MKYLFIISSITLIFSCTTKHSKTQIKVMHSQVDTNFGMGLYHAYSSDTSWDEMKIFGDSLNNLYSDSMFNVVVFFYPESSVPDLKESFALKQVSDEPYFITARYYDTSHTSEPNLAKYPQNFIKAKEYEKSKDK